MCAHGIAGQGEDGRDRGQGKGQGHKRALEGIPIADAGQLPRTDDAQPGQAKGHPRPIGQQDVGDDESHDGQHLYPGDPAGGPGYLQLDNGQS